LVIKEVTKLWKGQFVSIRTYEADQAIQKGGMKIIHDGQSMIVSVEQLKMLEPVSQMFKSKTGGQDYQLIDIKFKPNDSDQPELF
jgi:hypothetical protein